jgi:hypothetical protein
MKKLRLIATVLAVFISVLLCFDDSISSFIHVDTIEVPLQSDCSDTSHHHHFAPTDHFFQKNSFSFLEFNLSSDLNSILMDQPEANFFLSSIWQPPKKA